MPLPREAARREVGGEPASAERCSCHPGNHLARVREIVESVDDGDRGVGGELLHGLRASGGYCAVIPSEEGVDTMDRAPDRCNRFFSAKSIQRQEQEYSGLLIEQLSNRQRKEL